MQILKLHVVDTSDYNVMLSTFVVTEDYNRDACGSDLSVHIAQRLEATRGVIRIAFLAECEP
jgi:hypothetical protein